MKFYIDEKLALEKRSASESHWPTLLLLVDVNNAKIVTPFDRAQALHHRITTVELRRLDRTRTSEFRA